MRAGDDASAELHRSDRHVAGWSSEVHGSFADIVAEVARDLVERYKHVRRATKRFTHEATQLDVWLDVLAPRGSDAALEPLSQPLAWAVGKPTAQCGKRSSRRGAWPLIGAFRRCPTM